MRLPPAAVSSAFTMPAYAAGAAARTSGVAMADYGKAFTETKKAPDGPFGGFKTPGSVGGVPGDKSKSKQVELFERGGDYLFFQGPAPKTAIQDDLPSFLSIDNFKEAEFQGLGQIAVTATGFGSAAALAYLLVTG